MVIATLLCLMVAVPTWEGQRRGLLLDRSAGQVARARTALLETERAFTSLAAETRAFLITRDTVFLIRLRADLARARDASIRLEAAAADLGPGVAMPLQELRTRGAAWAALAAELADGRADAADRMITLAAGQRRLEDALDAAAGVGAALGRVEEATRGRIRASERLEDRIVGGLGLAAVVVSLFVAWMMRRIDETSRRLGESEARFRQIAESLREAIWVADPAYTRYHYINPAQERIWGRSMANALQDARSFLGAVHPDDRARVEAALESYAAGEHHSEYRILRPDGDVRWISARGYPVRDPWGRVFRTAGIAEDITEQKRAEEERERLLESERSARAELEAALHVRDRVLRIVSHDLKNPLHTIGMAAELLELPLTGEQRTQQIGIIRRTVARADRMVRDLLDAVRIQAGHEVAIQLAPVEVDALLAETVEALRLQARENHQQLTYEPAEGVPAVLADRDRVVQVLSNLLGNALKFTPEGGRILVRAEPNGAGVRFSIADTGRGIPEEVLPHLFEPFAQAKDTATLGTGLGLSIARGIVKAHGGDLTVESRPGEGTTFRFTLPVA